MWNLSGASAMIFSSADALIGGLLAEGRVDVMKQGFEVYEAEGGQSALRIVAACAVALVVAVVIYLFVRQKLRSATVEPWSLFRELCSANKLNPRQRLLLRKIAKAKGLNDPCSLFLDSRLWLVEPASEPHLCRPSKIKQIRHLQRILFQ